MKDVIPNDPFLIALGMAMAISGSITSQHRSKLEIETTKRLIEQNRKDQQHCIAMAEAFSKKS